MSEKKGNTAYRLLAKGAVNRVCVVGLFTLLLGLVLEKVWWVADACAQLRLQNCLALVILAIPLAIRQRWKWVAAAGVGIVLGLATSVPPLFETAPSATLATTDGERTSLRILTHNVEYDNENITEVLEAIQEADADVVLLLEVTAPWRERLKWLQNIYDHEVIEAEGGRFGIAMFSRLPVDSFDLEDFNGFDLQSVVAKLQYGGESITVIGTHPPPAVDGDLLRMRDWHLKSLARDVSGRREPVIVAGDLNITPVSSEYRRLLRETGLKSAGIPLHPTWSPFGIPGLGARIDHTLVSRQWRVVSSEVGPSCGSDHRMLVTELVLE